MCFFAPLHPARGNCNSVRKGWDGCLRQNRPMSRTRPLRRRRGVRSVSYDGLGSRLSIPARKENSRDITSRPPPKVNGTPTTVPREGAAAYNFPNANNHITGRRPTAHRPGIASPAWRLSTKWGSCQPVDLRRRESHLFRLLHARRGQQHGCGLQHLHRAALHRCHPGV